MKKKQCLQLAKPTPEQEGPEVETVQSECDEPSHSNAQAGDEPALPEGYRHIRSAIKALIAGEDKT